MTTFTSEFWTVDGTDLHNYAWGVEQVGMDQLPGRRGGNFVVPYRDGEIWRPKQFGPRTIALAMWVVDQNQAGTIGGVAQTRANVEILKRLFAPTDRQLALTKRINLGSTLTLSGLAEPTGTLDFTPDENFPEWMRFAVELSMADPFWYGDMVNTTVPFAGGTVTHPGSATARQMTITLNGPLTNPRLENQSTTRPVSFTYAGTIAGGSYVVLNTSTYTAIDNLGANQIAKVTHSGAHAWMELAPGGNSFVFTAGTGSGTAAFSFQPPYL